MKVLTAPEELVLKDNFSVFLAGSIEGDTARQWQDVVINSLSDNKDVILNPRRKTWDASSKRTSPGSLSIANIL